MDAIVCDGSRWLAKHAARRADAIVWTVRGVTEHGVYFTAPESRAPGHLLSQADFLAQYTPAPFEMCPGCGNCIDCKYN